MAFGSKRQIRNREKTTGALSAPRPPAGKSRERARALCKTACKILVLCAKARYTLSEVPHSQKTAKILVPVQSCGIWRFFVFFSSKVHKSDAVSPYENQFENCRKA